MRVDTSERWLGTLCARDLSPTLILCDEMVDVARGVPTVVGEVPAYDTFLFPLAVCIAKTYQKIGHSRVHLFVAIMPLHPVDAK